MAPFYELNERDIAAFEPEAKIGLLATVDPSGLPHITLITSLKAKTATQLTWGQFSEGESKKNVRSNPKTAFAVMNLDKDLWRGTATWTHSKTEGDDYVTYNQQPMFRYNAYFGIHTVHYMDLVELTERTAVSVPRLLTGSLVALAARLPARVTRRRRVLKPWAERLLLNPTTLKFVSYVADDGYPRIIPAVPCVSAGRGSLVIASAGRSDLDSIPPGAHVAIYALSLKMESVLMRGRFPELRNVAGLKAGTLDIDWVYNSMPPIPGQIYPMPPLLRKWSKTTPPDSSDRSTPETA